MSDKTNGTKPILIVDEAFLSRIMEGMGKLVSSTALVFINGADSTDPETGFSYKLTMQRDMGNTLAGINVLSRLFNLDRNETHFQAAQEMEALNAIIKAYANAK